MDLHLKPDRNWVQVRGPIPVPLILIQDPNINQDSFEGLDQGPNDVQLLRLGNREITSC